MKLKTVFTWLLLTMLMSGCQAESETQSYQQAERQPVVVKKEGVLCRLFFQDHETKQLRWADVRAGEIPTLDEIQSVPEFPTIDSEKQNLVQMEAEQGTLLVGVRDNDGGKLNSGWVLLSTGVLEETHGDHAHWKYDNPRVITTMLDKNQGNPAHLYLYQGSYYLANDQKDGYTRIDPASVQQSSTQPVTGGFHQGGGGHITLAVAANSTGYGTWIDGGGPNKGRVDVTAIKPEGNTEIAYSFNLPTGGIHGATAAVDKVFFAPTDGICWVMADLKPGEHRGEVPVKHIALGVDPETKKPLRTGAFTTHRDHVMFVSGQEDFAALSLLDATEPEPAIVRVRLPMKSGHSPTVPYVVKTAWGKRLAFVFHDKIGETKGEEHLSIIDLDPNQDLNFQDAKLIKTIPVGDSAVEGHYGHHEISMEHSGKYAFYTNPGDGSISVISLYDFQLVTTFSVGGKPTKVIALGEENHTH